MSINHVIWKAPFEDINTIQCYFGSSCLFTLFKLTLVIHSIVINYFAKSLFLSISCFSIKVNFSNVAKESSQWIICQCPLNINEILSKMIFWDASNINWKIFTFQFSNWLVIGYQLILIDFCQESLLFLRSQMMNWWIGLLMIFGSNFKFFFWFGSGSFLLSTILGFSWGHCYFMDVLLSWFWLIFTCWMVKMMGFYSWLIDGRNIGSNRSIIHTMIGSGIPMLRNFSGKNCGYGGF